MNYIFRFFSFAGFFLAGNIHSQTADIAQPKQREQVIATATKFIQNQREAVALPSDVINPFVGQEIPVIEDKVVEQEPAVVVAALADSELLARLAAQIPASGTFTLGGQAILLVGQKRLKVGDIVKISFEGRSHEVTISQIGTTSFTVRKGNLTHTRPTRMGP